MVAPTSVERLVRVQFEAAQAIRDARAYAASLKQTSAATNQLANTTKTSNFNVHGLQNASYQVSDFAIQVAGGQNALLAFTQQSSQLLGGFGVWPGVVGGVIAVVGTLGITMLDLLDASVQADDSIEDLRTSIEELGSTILTVEERIENWSDTYGFLSQRILEASNALDELNRAASQQQLGETFRENAEAVRQLAIDLQQINRDRAADTGQSIYSDSVVSQEDIDRLLALQAAAADTTLTMEEQSAATDELLEFVKALSVQYEDLDVAFDENIKRLSELVLLQVEMAKKTEEQSEAWIEQTKILKEQAEVTDGQTRALKSYGDELDRVTSDSTIDSVNRLAQAMRGLGNAPDTEFGPEPPGLPDREEPYTLPAPTPPSRSRGSGRAPQDPMIDSNLPPIPPPRPFDIEYYEEEMSYMDEITKELANSYETLLTPAINDFTDSLFDAERGWEDFAATLLESVAKMIIQLLVLKAIQEAVGLYASKAPETSTIPPIRPSAPVDFQAAHGAVVGDGSYVSTPGAFGTMAENGPEAIMPLRRTASGDLGVRGVAPTVNIYNSTDSDVQVSEGTSSDGGKSLEVFISKQVDRNLASGRHDRTLASSFGINRRSR